MMDKKITIVGSYNVGIFLKSDNFPDPGETVLAHTYFEGGGGKGSNQAIASKVLGADTAFIGKIGLDNYGNDALKLYKDYNVDTEFLFKDPDSHTGVSIILINSDGQNMISVALGANDKLTEADLDNCEAVFKKSKIIGFQLENKIEVVLHGLKKAKKNGSLTFLDPAPATLLSDEFYKNIDFIKPNEIEAEILTGIKVDNTNDAEKAGTFFLNKGVKNAIITLGSKGSVLVNNDGAKHFKTIDVTEKDTTGAGDIFAGAFLKYYADTKSIENSIKFANVAASLSVESYGVIESIPKSDEIINHLWKEN